MDSIANIVAKTHIHLKHTGADEQYLHHEPNEVRDKQVECMARSLILLH